jgi:hypothetical protein
MDKTCFLATDLAIVALVLGAAGPALAVDATGSWLGNGACWQSGRPQVARTEHDGSIMLISQRAAALFVEINGTAYRGESHDSNRNEIRARGSASMEGAGTFADPSEVLSLRIHVNEARGTRKIIVDSTVQNGLGERHCRYRFSRVSGGDPGIGPPPPVEVCGDGVVNDAPNEDCDGAATGTPCDGACRSDCTCATSCEPLDVTGSWEGTWDSDVTGESGRVVANLSQIDVLVFGPISFPPFGNESLSPPFLEMSTCAPAEFSTGALLPSGIAGTLDGIATNTSMAGTWGMSDGSDYGTWRMAR